MTDPNMPQDRAGATIYLCGKKSQLLAMAEMISENELTTFSQVNGYIWSEIEKLDEAIEGEH